MNQSHGTMHSTPPHRDARFGNPLSALSVLLGLGMAPAACSSQALEVPGSLQGNPDLMPGNVDHLAFPQGVRNKVDILFMVDNSNQMGAMQAQLQSRFSELFQPFQDLAADPTNPQYADLNIGVVTSDMGAGETGAPGCTTGPAGGDQGKLQALGAKAANTCLPPVGVNFVHYVFGPAGSEARSNLPGGQNLIDTLTCMTSVGDTGCGFVAPLESVYAALHNDLPANQGNAENPGFLRDDALLVVVFFTDQDDGSAPPDTDVYDKNLVAQYGYEDGYRQTRFAVMCGDPLAFPPYGDSGGPLQGCQGAPNPPGKQYDVNRYINLFTGTIAQGGVKDNPATDVMLIGIDAPETPFQVILSNPGTPAGTAYLPCATLDESSNPPCVPVLQRSCVGADPSFFGDPAVRLNSVIRSAKLNNIDSICDSDYTYALQAASKLVVSAVGAACLPDKLPTDPKTGALQLDCTVDNQTQSADGTLTTVSVPQCDTTGSTTPCWTIVPKNACASISPDGVGLTIYYGSTNGVANQAPDNTIALVSCVTQAM